jgi:hypothetical protein
MVPVTDDDRKAVVYCHTLIGEIADDILAGRRDAHPWVQGFAGHRLAAEAAAIERLSEALAPFTNEIDRLERDYGFDRPLHQGQTLMLPLSDLLNLRTALKEGPSHVG